jgi:hypothetical protein
MGTEVELRIVFLLGFNLSKSGRNLTARTAAKSNSWHRSLQCEGSDASTTATAHHSAILKTGRARLHPPTALSGNPLQRKRDDGPTTKSPRHPLRQRPAPPRNPPALLRRRRLRTSTPSNRIPIPLLKINLLQGGCKPQILNSPINFKNKGFGRQAPCLFSRECSQTSATDRYSPLRHRAGKYSPPAIKSLDPSRFLT